MPVVEKVEDEVLGVPPDSLEQAGPNLTMRLIPSTDLIDVQEIWTSIEAEHGDGALTCGWDWTETWLNAYGDLVPHFFVVGERAGRPRGIALITRGVRQRLGPVPIRTVHIGTAGEPARDSVFVEYNRLLVARQDRERFSRKLFDILRSGRHRRHEIMLNGFAPEDAGPFLDQDPGMFVRWETCPTTDLAAIRADGGDVIAALGKSTRYNIRRSMRLFGPIETEWSETAEHAEDILKDLVDLHQRRWTKANKPGVFSSERFSVFHRTLIRRLVPQGKAFLYRARTEHGVIGCLYGFVERNQVLFYQSGLASFDDDKLKPGLVAHALCMQDCLDRGFDAYDFLQGEARYKRELSTTERKLVWAVASPRGVTSHLLTYARRRKYGQLAAPTKR